VYKRQVHILNGRLPNGEPHIMDASEEEEMISVLIRSRRIYEETVEELAPLINSVSSYVPPRRARKLHVGLFGYSRRVGGISLPRAIPFAASLYSLGIPPELLGGRIYACLKDDEWDLVERHYINLEHDLRVAGGYLSWRNIDIIRDNCELISKKANMGKESLENALKKIVEDLKTIEGVFGINLGSKTPLQRKHENFVNNFLISYIEGDAASASSSLLEAAKIRRSLG
ncbi:MAG: phosphoenolpyruvate carboxylase, partial [Candidatus Bathyarchaeota archaeon]|nr:phosphoenolpyruvate carboxylase [Candidatus Bathyarchaeota archaeon]